MPNTRPPVARIHESDSGSSWSLEGYRAMLNAAGAEAFTDIIIPLYLTADTTPAMIEAGAKSGTLQACKYYPPHGTTGAEHGIPFAALIENGVFKAMADCGIMLCVHGEEHAMKEADYFARTSNAEEYFYRERLPRLIDAVPHLKIVAEHVTTKVAVDLVLQSGPHIAANVTPQHLLYTIGDLLRGFKYHLYCLPLLKFAEDRDALLQAVTSPHNTKFFAGTDSAPHTTKATACGCAAGCFTGGIAPQIYAEAFESAGIDLAGAEGQRIFKAFLCLNGPAFYKLPIPQKTFTLIRQEQAITALQTPEGAITPLPLGIGDRTTLPWRIAL